MSAEDLEPRSKSLPQASGWELVLSISVLTALAVAQPLYDLLSQNVAFFVVRGSKWGDVAGMIFITSVLLPLCLALPIALLHRVSLALGRFFALLMLAILASFLLWHGLQTGGQDAQLWWLVPPLAIVFAWAFDRIQALRTFVVFLTPALLVVPLLFLFDPSVRKALSRQEASEAVELAPGSIGSHAPVVFLLFDELSLASLVTPDLDLDERRFPHLAELAAGATWYRRATTAADTTVQAVPAILSGRFPEADQLPSFSDHPHNLFTMLGADYSIHAVEAATRLCPEELNQIGPDHGLRARLVGLMVDASVIWGQLALPPPLRSRLPPISQNWQGFVRGAEPDKKTAEDRDTEGGFFEMAMREAKSGDRLERFEEFLDVIEQGPRERALFYYHAMLPHRPWEYLANGQVYDDGSHVPGLAKEVWIGEQDVVDHSLQRYLEQVQMVDRLVGKTVERLQRIGIYEESLIIVVADHGVAFRSGHSRRLFEPGNAPEIAPVPLIIKAPGQSQGQIVDQPVSVLAILPTLALMLEAETGWPMDSGPLPGTPEESTQRSEWASRTGFYGKEIGAFELDDSLYAGIAEVARSIEHRLVLGPIGAWSVDSGPRPDLVGLEVASLENIESFTVELDLHNHKEYFERFADGEGEGSLRYFEGRVLPESWDPEPQTLAVVINGTVVASTWAYPRSKNVFQFSMLLPPGSLRAGFNELRLLRVLSEDSPIRYQLLEPLRLEARLEERAVAESSGVVMNGRHLTFGDSIRGNLMGTETRGERISIEGWAVDLQKGEPVDRIAVFAGDEMIASSIPRLPNRWAVDYYGAESYLVSSFQIAVDRNLLPDLAKEGVHVYALSGSSARELQSTYGDLDQSRDWLERSNGRRYRLAAASSTGERSQAVAFLDILGAQRHMPVFFGWAGRPEQMLAAEEIVVFRDGGYVTHFKMNRRRDDLVEAGTAPAELADSGFAYRGHPGDVQDLHEGRLQFVAVFPENFAQLVDLRVQ